MRLSLGQYINVSAISHLLLFVRRPGLLLPKDSFASVSHISWAALRDGGVRAVLFDKDNTLTAPYEATLHPSAASGLQSAISMFGAENVAVLSNSAGTADDSGKNAPIKGCNVFVSAVH
jgi:phosphatidylglycerophosphatase GEP4